MPKKPRPPKPDGPPPLSNKDHLERANYALQASLLLRHLGVNRAAHGGEISTTSTTKPAKASTSVQPAQRSSEAGASQAPADPTREAGRDAGTRGAEGSRSGARSRKRRSKGGKEPLGDLARAEVTSMRKWTVHNQVKLDPTVKRSLCSCSTVLVPGMTSRVRVKSSKQHKHRLVTSCLLCGNSTSVPMKKANWMSRERPAPVEPAAEEQAEQQPGAAPEAEKIEGHVMWAGSERITGWGEVSAAAQPASSSAQ